MATEDYQEYPIQIKVTQHSGDLGLEKPVREFRDTPLSEAGANLVTPSGSEDINALVENAVSEVGSPDDLLSDRELLDQELRRLHENDAPKRKEHKETSEHRNGKKWLLTAAALTGVGAAALGINTIANNQTAEVPQPTDSSSETPTVLNETETLQATIDARPEVGSPEYTALFDGVRIPYIEGQSAEDVVVAYQNALDNYDDMGILDAPKTGEEKQQWSLENNTPTKEATYAGIVDQLNLEYYSNGLGEAMFGPNWQSSEFAQAAIPRHQDAQELVVLDYLNSNMGSEYNSVTTIDKSTLKIIDQDESNILARYSASNEYGYSQPGSVHLQKMDIGNGVYGWFVVGNAG